MTVLKVIITDGISRKVQDLRVMRPHWHGNNSVSAAQEFPNLQIGLLCFARYIFNNFK